MKLLLPALIALAAALPVASWADVLVTETLLTTNAADDFDAAISGTSVVFTTTRAGNDDVYGVVPGGAGPTGIAVGASTQNQPDISGTSVVFVDDAFGNDNIYTVPFTSGTPQIRTTNAAQDDRPAISGDDVVFITRRGGNDDVYHVDLVLDLVSALTNTPLGESFAVIDQGTAIFHRFEFPVINLYGIPIGGTEFPVSTSSSSDFSPSISGDRVAFIRADAASRT